MLELTKYESSFHLLAMISSANSRMDSSDARSSFLQKTLLLYVAAMISARASSHFSMLRQAIITWPPVVTRTGHV